MDLIGLLSSVYEAAAAIDTGRKGFATRGKEQEGRVFYEKGIAKALSAFHETQATADPETIILAEYTFLTQELEFCEKADKDSITSLSKAIRTFDDTFLALKTVEGSNYEVVEQAISHEKEYRVKAFPMDAFDIAFISHQIYLHNVLLALGVNMYTQLSLILVKVPLIIKNSIGTKGSQYGFSTGGIYWERIDG